MGDQPIARVDAVGAGNMAGDLIGKGKTVHAVQTKYQTAVFVQKPRDIMEVEKRCMTEASLAGESCYYGWGSGKDRVEGPSIDCAMIAARNWGNAAIDMEPIIETPTAWIMGAVFIDLETGFTYPRQFRQSKNWTVYGKMDAERKTDVRFQIGQSKAQRNCILRALPKWLLDKMVDKAKEGVKATIEKYIKSNSIESARKVTLDALVKHGVSLERIEKKYGKKYGAWDVEILVLLKGDVRALADGAESADALFPENTEKQQPATGSLDPEEMKAGDPASHQGYGDQKMSGDGMPYPEEVEPDERVELLKKIELLEASLPAKHKPSKVDMRAEVMGQASINDEVPIDALHAYAAYLAEVIEGLGIEKGDDF